MRRRFSLRAGEYAQRDRIQRAIAKDLVARIDFPFRRVLDVGCGHGGIHALIGSKCERFVGVDFAPGMCALHPTEAGTVVYELDFNNPDELEQTLSLEGHFDLIVSASALQWASSLERTLRALRPLGKGFALAILTSRTFEELHTKAGTQSPLPSRETIEETIASVLGLPSRVDRYTIEFASAKELLAYVRCSGVSAFHHGLGYRAAKALLGETALTKLSFEVVTAVGSPLKG